MKASTLVACLLVVSRSALAQISDCSNEAHPPTYADFAGYANKLSVTYKIPAVVLKAVMEQESRWTQFTDSQGNVPLISADGGIGIMQVTPSANNPNLFYLGSIDSLNSDGENPFTVNAANETVDLGLLRSCWQYNMEIGARILLGKVKSSSTDYLDLRILENWYYPLAYYNGAYPYLATDSQSRRHECNDPINPERSRNVGSNNSLYRDKYTFPYQECVFNIISQKYLIQSSRAGYFGSAQSVVLPGPSAVGTGDGHYQYLSQAFQFFNFAEFHDDGTAKVGPAPGTIYQNVPFHLVQFGGGNTTIKTITKGNGVFVPAASIKLNGVTAGSTDSTGQLITPTIQCGNIYVEALVGALHYAGFINFQCSSSSNVTRNRKAMASVDTASAAANSYTLEMDSDTSCGSISPVNNFSVGDRVEVYGTGNGLRARYPDPCSGSYAVMPDLSAGTIVGSWQCCNGYIRWKVRYDGLSGIDVWSAEGEPSTGQQFLRKKQSSTCSYSLAPGRLDLNTNGAAASGFNVNTGASCYWTAVSNLDWISITTNGSGTGPAQVTFSVSANSTPYSRTGNIVVGDQTFIVTQPGNGTATSGWALTVASSNPNSGVGVTVSPSDTNGLGNGATIFTRNYNAYTLVNLTAPAGAGSNTFKKWQRDGVDWSTSTGTNLTMEGNHTMTAVYVPVSDHYLAVFISPQQAIDAGAKWYLQGNGPYDSGYSLGPLSPGSTVPGLTFKPINGWIAPPDQSVVIANSGPTIVRVTYTLPPSLLLSTNQINVGWSSGGANLLVTNTGGGSLNWSASTTDSWMTLELSSGVAASGASNPLSFTFQPNNSSVGRNGTITVADSSAIGSPQSITVSQLGKLQVTSVARPNANTFTLTWTADPAQTYSVLRSSDLSFTTYDVIVSGVSGSNPTFTDTTLPPNTTAMFYKVRLDP